MDEVSTDADAQILTISVDSSKTDASGWDTPDEHNEVNSAIEYTENVTSYPDINGNIVDGTAGTEYVVNPGGYQLGLANRFTQAQGTANIRRSSTARVRKRKIQNGDVVIFLGLTSTSLDMTLTYDTEQDW